ncbi:hypothetical protein D1872_281430 [compost metagenome]
MAISRLLQACFKLADACDDLVQTVRESFLACSRGSETFVGLADSCSRFAQAGLDLSQSLRQLRCSRAGFPDRSLDALIIRILRQFRITRLKRRKGFAQACKGRRHSGELLLQAANPVSDRRNTFACLAIGLKKLIAGFR